MIEEKYLVLSSQKLGIFIAILVGIVDLMLASGFYEAKTIFTICIITFGLLMFYLYCNFQLLILTIYRLAKHKSKQSKTIVNQFFNNIDVIKAENIELKEITNNQVAINTTTLTEKEKQAIEYTKKSFEKFVEKEEDLENICQEIIAYSNGKTDFLNSKSVKVKDLTNNDLYHFGWNIWNHFKIGKQEIIADFLQKIFAEKLGNQSQSTIISHLRDDEKKGKIIIQKDITILINKN